MPSLRFRTRSLGTAITFLLLHTTALAAPPAQRQDLTAAQRQIELLERLVARSAAATPITPGERYHFNYARLQADLLRVRVGIEHYLTPSRAQPRDPGALSGQYRAEAAPPSPPAPERAP